MTVSLLLQILALIALVLAAFGVKNTRVTVGWLGMALWLASLMVVSIR